MITNHSQVVNCFELKRISSFSFQNSKGYSRNSSKDPMDARSRQMEDPLIIENICKMNAWVHLGFSYIFMHL